MYQEVHRHPCTILQEDGGEGLDFYIQEREAFLVCPSGEGHVHYVEGF